MRRTTLVKPVEPFFSYHESVGLKNKQIEVNYTRKGL